MFFKISNKVESNYPCNYKLPNGNFLNCDLGWKQDGSVFYKGYTLEVKSTKDVINELRIDPTPKHKGNFVLILCDNEYTTITHNVHRCFPLQYNEHCVTNLEKIFTPVWADAYLKIDKNLKNVNK